MQRYAFHRICLTAIGAWIAISASCLEAIAQQGKPQRVTATRTTSAVTVDGQLNEEIWRKGEVSGSFLQQEPSYGAAPTEGTEVRVRFDDKTLYIGARLRDRDPGGIVRNVGTRDAERPSDWFEVALDPSHDKRSGYYFRVTAGGTRLDGTISQNSDRNSS